MMHMIVGMHAGLVERCSAGGAIPPRTVLGDAIKALTRWDKACEAAGDLGGRVNALTQACTWNLMLQDHSAAKAAAQQALEVADRHGVPELVAVASLTLAEAYVASGDGVQARQAADEALSSFEQMEDAAGCQEARRVIEAAKDVMSRPKPASKSLPSPTTREAKYRPLKAAHQEAKQPHSTPESVVPSHFRSHGDAFEDTALDQPTPAKGQLPERRPRKAFSQKAAECDPGPARNHKVQDSRLQERDEDAMRGRPPDQELRRQQLRNSLDAKPISLEESMVLARSKQPKQQSDREMRQEEIRKGLHDSLRKSERPDPEVKSDPLISVLAAVRPHWTDNDLLSVQEKLAAISITSPQDLLQGLRQSGGAKLLNCQLKAAGKRALKMETLIDLRNHLVAQPRH